MKNAQYYKRGLSSEEEEEEEEKQWEGCATYVDETGQRGGACAFAHNVLRACKTWETPVYKKPVSKNHAVDRQGRPHNSCFERLWLFVE